MCTQGFMEALNLAVSHRDTCVESLPPGLPYRCEFLYEGQLDAQGGEAIGREIGRELYHFKRHAVSLHILRVGGSDSVRHNVVIDVA